MKPKVGSNRVKIESENERILYNVLSERISVFAFALFSGGFGEANVVKKSIISLPKGARKRKRNKTIIPCAATVPPRCRVGQKA